MPQSRNIESGIFHTTHKLQAILLIEECTIHWDAHNNDTYGRRRTPFIHPEHQLHTNVKPLKSLTDFNYSCCMTRWNLLPWTSLVPYQRRPSESGIYFSSQMDIQNLHVQLLHQKTSSMHVANIFIDNWIILFGSLMYLLMDNGSQFRSKLCNPSAKILEQNNSRPPSTIHKPTNKRKDFIELSSHDYETMSENIKRIRNCLSNLWRTRITIRRSEQQTYHR